MDGLNIYGLLFIVGIMIPNTIYTITHKDGFKNNYQNKLVEILEQIGRFGCMIFMVVLLPSLSSGFWFLEAKRIYIILGIVLVLSYCLGWIVFWKENSLRKSMILSILPSILFLECSVLMLNIPLIIFSLIFACNHILLSYKNAVL